MVEARRFTLLNVVVVLLLLLFGMVLILYYVARAKQASLRDATAERMATLYRALKQYEDRQGYFPGYTSVQAENSAGQPVRASWAFAILPYVSDNPQAASLYEKYGPAGPDASRGKTPDERLPLFIAPGSHRAAGPALSFVVNSGLPDGTATREIPADWPANGICHDLFPSRIDGSPVAQSKVSAEFIQDHDGLDQTLLLAENVDAGNWTDVAEPRIGFTWLPTLDPPPAARVNGKPSAVDNNPYYLARPSGRFPPTAVVIFASGRQHFMAADIDYLVYMRQMCPADDLAAPAGADPDYQLPSELTPLPNGPAPAVSPITGESR